MACELCREGDLWIKTCRTPSGTLIKICDLCYAEHATELIIVPGDMVVTARCDGCGHYGNPREFQEVRLGGRKGAYSGLCPGCGEEGEGRR